MFRKKSLLRTKEELIRRTTRKKRAMGKMSDIIRRELLSESDEDDPAVVIHVSTIVSVGK